MRSVVTGVGAYLPETVVIQRGPGQDRRHQRRVDPRADRHPGAPPGRARTSTDLRPRRRGGPRRPGRPPAAAAADVDLIIVATTTPDLTFPATAAIVQRKPGADLSGLRRPGGVLGLRLRPVGGRRLRGAGPGQVRRGHRRRDHDLACSTTPTAAPACCSATAPARWWSSRCEGQGRPPTTAGLLGFALRSDGAKRDLLYTDGGAPRPRPTGHLRMVGNQVFRHAVVNIAEAVAGRCRGRPA